MLHQEMFARLKGAVQRHPKTEGLEHFTHLLPHLMHAALEPYRPQIVDAGIKQYDGYSDVALRCVHNPDLAHIIYFGVPPRGKGVRVRVDRFFEVNEDNLPIRQSVEAMFARSKQSSSDGLQAYWKDIGTIIDPFTRPVITEVDPLIVDAYTKSRVDRFEGESAQYFWPYWAHVAGPLTRYLLLDAANGHMSNLKQRAPGVHTVYRRQTASVVQKGF